MRSTTDECIGSAYMSGSRPFDQSHFVKTTAIHREATTCTETVLVKARLVASGLAPTHRNAEEEHRQHDEQDRKL